MHITLKHCCILLVVTRETVRLIKLATNKVTTIWILGRGAVLQLSGRAVLHLSSRSVAKCDLCDDRVTQILPNTGPTGNPRISFAKVHVRLSQMMQPCRTCGYQNMHIYFNIFMSDHPKFVWTTQRTNWVVRSATQSFSLATALGVYLGSGEKRKKKFGVSSGVEPQG